MHFPPSLPHAFHREIRKMQHLNPFDTDFTGEKIPGFYTPSRIKLFFKMLEDMRNNTRISRKPMPDSLKKEFAEMNKEYSGYKTYEKYYLKKERERSS